MSDLQSQLQSTLSGAYTLERELGGGGMSRVFVADEIRLGRKVVVKVLSPELAAGISAERFEREIRMAASLQQANIVPVLATGDTNGLPYYTMPFVEGESLRRRMAKQPPLLISEILRILGDVARALQYAHDRGIVHRDIKPDNVLLSGGTAVVTDFGIAKALSDSRTGGDANRATLTQLGTSIGTPAYMAPEQAAGDPDVDHRADIYAFGCMAFELLAGEPPFSGRKPARVLAAHVGEPPRSIAELRPDAPAGLSDLVMRCLAKDAEERPQSASDTIATLNNVTSGSGMQAMPSVIMHGPAAFRRAPLMYEAAVVAVAALIIAFMLMRALGVGPVGSLFATGKLSQRDVLLVSDFGVSRADSSVGSVVAEGVRVNLAESQSIKLFNPANVAAALGRMQLPPTSKLDIALARQLAQREGVKAIVTGDVTGLGSGFVIGLRLVAADSGTVFAAFQTTIDGPSQLVKGVDDVTRRLRGKIGESLKSVQASPPLEQVTTSSFDALKAYTEGARAFDIEHDFAKAIQLLRRAVTIDTGFAMAWRKLGTAMSSAFYPSSAVDSAITKAYQMRTRLSENERYLTEGYYFQRGPGHDRQRAIAAYQALIDRGDTAYAANNLAVALLSMREFAEAESLFRLAMRASPDNSVPLPNLVNMAVAEGKSELLDSLATLEAKRIPNSQPYLYALYLIPYSAGQYDRAELVLDSVNSTSRSNDVRAMASFLSSGLLAVHGRLNESAKRYREYAALAAQLGSATLPISESINLAAYDVRLRNQPQRAAARLDAALAVHPLAGLPERDRPYTLLASTYAIAGRPGRARAVLGQLAQIKDTAFLRSVQPYAHAALGEIALAEKRYGDAVREFQRADTATDGRPVNEDPASVHFNLGRAYDLANKPDSAIAELEAFLRVHYDSRLDDDRFGLAGVHKRLGELYDAKGDRDKAISHLSAFVDLWKHADPALQPAVSDAKRRLAKLQAGGRS